MIDLTPQRPADGVFALYKCALKTGQELATTVVHMENWKDVRGIVLIGGLLDKHHDIEPTIANVMCNIAHGAAVKDAKGAIGALEGAATHLTIKSAREGVGNTIAILRRNYKINDYIAPPGVPDAPDAP